MVGTTGSPRKAHSRSSGPEFFWFQAKYVPLVDGFFQVPVPKLSSSARIIAATAVLAAPAAWGACPEPVLQAIADGVYAIPGRGVVPARDNCGRSANGFVAVGPGGAILIDPGPSLREGLALKRVLAHKLQRPVVALIDTHAHPENVMAAVAFPKVPVIASDLTAGLMAERCPRCLARLKREVGEDGMRGTEIVLPTRTVPQSDTRVIGGRSLRILRFEHAHVRGDLAVLDTATGTLFAGGLAVSGFVPEMGESSLAGWRKAIAELTALAPRRTVPGHGKAAAGDPLAETRAYLDDVTAFVRRELKGGADLASALERADMPTYRPWTGYGQRHLLNVQRAWQELEQDFFFGAQD